MTPTLFGRIQTRIFLIGVIGSLWTLVVSPFLPDTPDDLGNTYKVTFAVLLVVGLAGIVWELIYHGLQQFRWEKDWPSFFGLLNGINEGIVIWLILVAGWAPGPAGDGVPGLPFVIHFSTTWIVTFLFVNGPMRVPALRWRFRGGRLV